ncbi:MAG: hypothetical protein ACK2UC_03495 [Anaerolineae bacterium]|jgi:hypothetical protein
MYVNLELENAGTYPKRISAEPPRDQSERATARSGHRLFLVVLIVALISVLVVQLVGSAYEAGLSADALDAGEGLRSNAPGADLVPTPDPRGNASPYVFEPVRLSGGGGSIQLPK